MSFSHAFAEARHQAEALGNLVRGLELAEAARASSADAEERFFLRDLSRWILSRQAQPRSEEGAVGVVHAILIDADRSGEAFVTRLVAEESAAPEPAAVALGELCGRTERCLFRLLARRGRLPSLGAYRVRFSDPPALRRYKITGRSSEAALALALFSLWSGRPIPAGLIVSAALGEDGALLPVTDLEAKVRAALRERPQLSAFVHAAVEKLAPGADPRLRGIGSLEELLVAVFGSEALGAPLPVMDLEGSLSIGLELYEKRGNFETALEVLQAARALACDQRRQSGRRDGFRVEEFLCRWRAGSCLVHLGDPRAALEELEAARLLGEELWAAGELNPQHYLNARGSLAVLLRDLHRFDEAEALLVRTLEEQRALRQDKREIGKTLGNLGELWTMMGRFDAAEAALQEALAGLRAVYPEEVPRELCYLGNLALRRGQPEQALGLYEEGLEENRRVVRGQSANAAFLRYGLARALLACGRADEALSGAERALAALPVEQVYPRQLILKQRGLAELALNLPGAEATLLEAGDLRRARGGLARFGVSTALAELALHRLARGDEAGALPLVERFASASTELLDELWATGRAERLQDLLEHLAASDAGIVEVLARELRQACDLFPY